MPDQGANARGRVAAIACANDGSWPFAARAERRPVLQELLAEAANGCDGVSATAIRACGIVGRSFLDAAASAHDLLFENASHCGSLLKCRGLRTTPKGIRTRRQRGR